MLSTFNYADGVQSTPCIGGKLRTQRLITGTTQYRSLRGRDVKLALIGSRPICCFRQAQSPTVR
jgi:hypothetical protein